MLIIKRKSDLVHYLSREAFKGKNIGFVPTMGALHQGHLSLIQQSNAASDLTIVSIFVNPTQFNDPADFDKYPVTIEQDIYQLEHIGCDVLFLPAVSEIYPEGLQASKMQHYDLGYLETVFEGKYRPGHFQGVCQVVHRLLDIVRPDVLYMGQKDYQQCMVISKLLQLISCPAKLVIGNTLREPDGLAMSSRNMRLSDEERTMATGIYNTLTYIKENIRPGSTSVIIDEGLKMLEQNGFNADYLAVADANNLTPLPYWDGKTDIVIITAAYLGSVRLIDNMVLHPNFADNGN